jgi:hypothetical protein
MTIFEPVGRVRLRPRPRRYGLNVFGVRCEGTFREWVEDALGMLMMGVYLIVAYVWMAVVV